MTKHVVFVQPKSTGGNFEYVAIPRQGMTFLSAALKQYVELGNQRGERVVVATCTRSLQDQLFERDLPGGEATMLAFETLTLAPIDRDMVDPALLTEAELLWLNAYHADVERQLLPLLDEGDSAWLTSRCSPLAR